MFYAGSEIEIKELSDSGHIEGVLAGFDNVDSHGDVIRPGAFTKTLTERGDRPLPMLLHHDMSRPIGAWKRWQQLPKGLFVQGKISLATRDGQEAHALAREGALSGLSIGFRTTKSQPIPETGGNELIEVRLVEGSLVTVPSNPTTYVTAVKDITSARDIAEFLQSRGISGRKAKAAAGLTWRALQQGGSLDEDEDAADAELAALIMKQTARLRSLGGQ